MEYRESRARVPLEDAKRQAQKSVHRVDGGVQVNPITMDYRQLTEEEGARPGVFTSESVIHPAVQGHDGARPTGSYSTSVYNEGGGKMTNNHTRRMVMDHDRSIESALRQADGTDSLYYRSGRAKLSVAMAPAEFRSGAGDAYEEGHQRHG
ncbi:hypothetical protein [Streptomyces katrae]|uniref:Uncharacterized protein n=1 Tax=Streptomyces katrae TaxID=68223 RepID=A0A0F4JTM2_9ACTN|nr:hypothetical protein [Streptomyces katrae]KJY37093.1 hypothetical protein VR44_06510 [Streptomyces katrae]